MRRSSRWEVLGLRPLVVITAVAMATLVALPVSTWRSAETGPVYRGFDPNLVPISNLSFGVDNPGVIQVSTDALRITTVSSSRPAAQLLTTSLTRFTADMSLVVMENPPGTEPLRIGVWSPRSNSGYFIVFSGAPTNSITADAIADGAAAQTLLGGRVATQVLGSYTVGQPYHLRVVVDKAANTIAYRLTGDAGPTSGDPAMSLVGGPSGPSYSDISSSVVPVKGGQQYRFGSLVKSVSGSNAFKVSVVWLDKRGSLLGYAGDWMLVSRLNGWTKVDEEGTAPVQATQARLLLGSGDGTSLLFTDAYLIDESRPEVNLVPNPNLRSGAAGWSFVTRPGSSPQIVTPSPLSAYALFSPSDAPGLLRETKLSLTVSAFSSGGSSTSVLQGYELKLPAATAGAIRIDDPRATLILITLLVIGLGLISLRIITTLFDRVMSWREIGLWRRLRYSELRVRTGLVIALGAVVSGVLFINALLFGLGNSPFDMACQMLWSYIAVEYGPQTLYMLPSVVSTAGVWGGVPYHEAVFPYQPVMAYLFSVEGWIDRLLLSRPGSFTASSFQLEFVAKAVNVLFMLGDGLLIYLILRRWRMPSRGSLLAVSLFVLNPAVWFSASIFGANHVLSVFFVLLSIYLAEIGRPTGAWICLGLATLTRPQMLVFSLLVALVLWKKFRIGSNTVSMSWAIVCCFILVAPFAMQTSPSLPVDMLSNTVRVQELGGNEKALTTVSLDAYSVWPLVTRIASGQVGLGRIFYPSDSFLFGAFTYQQVAWLITAGWLALACALIAFRSRVSMAEGGYIPVVALGITGFLMLLTGVSSAHFILALPFLILAKRFIGLPTYLSAIAIWSVTTLIAMWGVLGYDLASANYLNLPLFGTGPGLRWLTAMVTDLYSSDRLITAGALANCVVLVVVMAAAFRSLVARPVAAAPALPMASPAQRIG